MSVARRLRALAWGLPLLAACGDSSRGRPPAAEFLLATGDSTYWVRATPTGLSVRSSPLLLTWDGRDLHELFVTDDEHAWPDALFLSQRLWRRTLLTGDSIELARDSVIAPLVRRYEVAHRDEPPLDDDEDFAEEPSETASAEFEILDAHGPYISWARHINVDVADSLAHRHELTWRVTDVRSGEVASCSTLFGAAAQARFLAASERAFRVMHDSLRHLARGGAAVDSGAHGVLRFDPRAFSLSDKDGDPRIIPMAAAPDAAGQLTSLALPMIDVAPPHPPWWRLAREQLPSVAVDSATLVWSRSGYRVFARPALAGDRLEFTIAGPGGSRSREQVIATLPGPAWSLFALDTIPQDAPLRRALVRAFDDAQRYGDPPRQLARAVEPWRPLLVSRHARASRREAQQSGRRPPRVTARPRVRPAG